MNVFYRVDKSHSKTVGGTGLGLSIVKHIAMVHGADIKGQKYSWKGNYYNSHVQAGIIIFLYAVEDSILSSTAFCLGFHTMCYHNIFLSETEVII